MKKGKRSGKYARIFVAVTIAAIALMAVMASAFPHDEQVKRTPVRVTGGSRSLKALYHFGDVNDTQIVAAQQFGIIPLRTRDELDSIVISQLKKVEPSNSLWIEPLTHSVPYLTPGAEDLLNSIATNFQNKLRERGMAQYQIVVTSLLRTDDDVRRLMRVNRNAVRQSCHAYGTTFDIAYNCFQAVDSMPDFEGRAVSHRELINTLGETLKELRDSNRCYVKFERRQPCFHITSRQ